jgi:polar amino acid transport system substrate-binding protein
MRPLNRRVAVAIALSSVVVMGIAACGGSSKSSGDSKSAGSGKPTVIAALHDLLPASVKQSGELRFVGDSNAPNRIVAPDGTVTGVDPDLREALGAVLGVKVSLAIISDNATARTGILADRYDVLMGPSNLTADRAKQFDSVAYENTGIAFVVPKTSSSIKTALDLCGKQVAAIKGGSITALLDEQSAECTAKGKAAITVVNLADPNTMILAAKAARVDAVSLDTATAGYSVKQDKTLSLLPGSVDLKGGVLAAGALTTKAVSPALFGAFQAIFANGEYSRIMKKWGLDSTMVTAPLLNYINPA